MKKYKVKVTMPKQGDVSGYMPENVFAYGGQYGHSLDLGSKRVYSQMGQPDGFAASNSKLQPVPRQMANLEAERGETAYGDLDADGMMELQEIAGKRHAEKDQYGQGGTPLNLQPGTFIFSDTKAMRLGGAELAQFGKSADSKKKYTPAELSKQYDITKYKAIIEDPKADPIAKRTAQYMLNNNNFKLAQLALAQEAKKGFANGIPQVALPALPREMQEQLQGTQEAESQERPNEAAEYMKGGGSTFSGNAWYQDGGVYTPDYSTMAYGGIHIDPSKKGTFKAQATRMGMGTQEAAAHILANKEDYSPEMVKKAVFAHNFAKAEGGQLDMYQTKGEVKKFTPWPGDIYSGVHNASPYSSTSWEDYAKSIGYNGPAGDNLALQKFIMQDPKRAAKINALHKKYGTPTGGMFDSKLGYRWEQFKDQETKSNPWLPNDLVALNETQQYPTDNESTEVPGFPDEPEGIYQSKQKAEDTKVSPNKFNTQDANDKFRTMKPDDWAQTAAMLSMAGIPIMNAYKMTPRLTEVKGTYMDPTRSYAANEEAAAQQLAGARTFGNPRTYAAMASQVAGKQLEGNANIQNQINAGNVQIANQLEAMNAQYRDKYFDEKMKADAMYNEQVNAVNKENFRNLDAASKQMLAARQNAFSNAMMMDMVNKANQIYSVDPRTGRTIMKAGKDPFTSSSAGNQDYYTQLKGIADNLKGKFPGLTDNEALKHAQDMLVGKQTTRYDSSGAMSGYNQILPYLAMMGKNQAAANFYQKLGGIVDAHSIFPF